MSTTMATAQKHGRSLLKKSKPAAASSAPAAKSAGRRLHHTRQLVGIDVGSSAVRAAEVELGSGAPVLVAFSQVGLPPGTIVDGEVRDVTAVTDAVRRLWQNAKFSTRSVVVGIAGLRAITRELDLPWVPDNEVDSAVRFQSEEVIPFAPDQTLLSAQVLADVTTAEGTKSRRVLVAAAHRELIDGVVGAVEQAGLEVEGVDLVSSALVRALVDPRTVTDQPEAIVSIGAGLTVVVVHQAGRPLFVRTVGIGGQAGTAAVSQALDIPLPDAEALKRRADDANPQAYATLQAIRPVVDDIVGEIRNSIQYFSSLPGNGAVSRVLVTGGGSLLYGLLPALQAQIGVPVVPVSPLERLNTADLQIDEAQAAMLAPVLATSIGLGLPEPNPGVRKFNLVPPEILRRAFERRVTRYSWTGGALLAAAVVIFAVWRVLAVHSAENDVHNLQASVTTLKAEIPTFSSVVRAVDELHTARGEVTRLAGNAVDWAAVIAQIDKVVPPGLGVTAFNGQTVGAGAGTTPAGASSPPPASAAPPGATLTGGIGTMTLSVGGSYPNTAHFSPVAEWIDAISGAPLFSPPSVSSVANIPTGGNTTVTFQSTISITSAGSLAKNGSF
ncbi:MAG TPA: type IV pilus assembly protein PilM [Acidimicrobiales bacterium]|nr:type IV pilus assembly protein PilM [Acidimicrobiales bacterium]